MQWLHEICTVRNKAVVKIYHTNELTQLPLRFWLRELLDSSHLVWKRCDATAVDVMTQEIRGAGAQLTLVWIDDHPVFRETLKNETEMMQMFLWRSAGNEDIIYVCIRER